MINDHTTNLQQTLTSNITYVRARMREAAERAGRHVEEITLVAVSKTKPLEMVEMAYNAGVTNFGENRVQEALPKIAAFYQEETQETQPEQSRRRACWHMIGHLQSNKASKVVGAFDIVQSVDSLHLAQVLNRHAGEHNMRLAVFLQVNVAGETSKEGISPQETPGLARQIVALPHLQVEGLMTIAPLVQNPEETRPVFQHLRMLRDRLRQELPDASWQHLSMGMTDDYGIAIEEGATIVRVGRAIFGERIYKG